MKIAVSGDESIVLVLTLAAFVFTLVLSILLGRWIRRKTCQNLHPDSKWDGTSSNLVLDYPRKAAAYASVPITLMGFLLLAVLIALIADPERDRSYAQILFFSVMIGLSAAGSSLTSLSHRGTEFFINSKGIGKKTAKKGSSFIEWNDIRELRLSPIVPNHFILVTKTGRMRIPLFLNGMTDLASMLAVKVPQERWENGVEGTVEKLVKGLY